MSSIHRSQARMSQMLRAYSAAVAAPKAFTSTTMQELSARADARERQALLAKSREQAIGNPKQIPSNGGMPADALQKPMTEGGMPISLMRMMVFPPGAL